MILPDEPRFTKAQLDALYAAVQVNDAVDAAAAPPARIDIDLDDAQLLQCYRLSRQLWLERRDRAGLRTMAWRLAWRRDLDPAERLRFKHARAKYKQLRFAYANIDSSHRYPRMIHWVTAVMGHLQDDVRHRRTAAAIARALLLRLMLSGVPDRLTRRGVDRLRPDGAASFRRYLDEQVGVIRHALAHPTITGREFHEIRKIVSRQASLFVAAGTLYPSPEFDATFRFLALINGMMGAMHDDLVERRISGTQDYHADRFAFPPEIAGRLRALTELFHFRDGGKTVM